jgi:hypothetical protein
MEGSDNPVATAPAPLGTVAGSSIGEWMEEALSDPDSKAFMEKEYLDYVIENMRELHNGLQRSTIIILTLVLLFALMATGSITAIDLGITEITNLSPVHKLLPAIFSVYLIQITVSFAQYNIAEMAFFGIMKSRHPVVREKDLDYIIKPPSLDNFAALVDSMFFNEKRMVFAKRVSLSIGVAYYGLLLLLPIVFGIFAAISLFQEYGHTDILVWTSTVVTALSVIVTVVVLTLLFDERLSN